MNVNIFLASSAELKDDRNNFQLFINQLNEDWSGKDVFFVTKTWEDDFIDAMSGDGLQSRYNEAIAECDIFLMLFFTKVGKYTEQEFEVAFKNFQLNKKPLVYTYFKEDYISTGKIGDEIVSLLNFKKKLSELKHYVSTYTSIEDLQWKFSRQLERSYGDKYSMNFDINKITNKSQIDSLTIERVCKLLSPQSDESILEELKLNELICRASDFAKNAVFQLAKLNRRSYRLSNRDLMARSIPLFEILADTNTRKDRHDYFGQLAYALKDQNNADWKRAEENFNIAIDIRGKNEPEYFYEFNRAICKLSLHDPADELVKRSVLEDLKVAKKVNGFEKVLNDIENRILNDWLNKNAINYNEL